MGMWGEYVPVHVRRQQAKKQMDKLQKKGKLIEPINIEGNTIAKQFWGKKWCEHIENFADYSNRLPRGKTYVRNGSVCHLGISEGTIEAIVSGSSLYSVSIQIKMLSKEKWQAIKDKCSGMIGSILELLQGKISKNVMEIVADDHTGLFPLKKEISYSCSCPDAAMMCKHVAAVLYGIGSRLDLRPELLFRLRGLDPQELVSLSAALDTKETKNTLQNDQLEALFGIDLGSSETSLSSKPSLAATKSEPFAEIKSKTLKTKKPKVQFNINALTGDSIKFLRTKANLSVSDFADELGVTPASIYRWERAENLLRLQNNPKESLKRLAEKWL